MIMEQILTDKVPLETFSLFTTAEQYLNGAIFQFKRINERKKRQKKTRNPRTVTLEGILPFIH